MQPDLPFSFLLFCLSRFFPQYRKRMPEERHLFFGPYEINMPNEHTILTQRKSLTFFLLRMPSRPSASAQGQAQQTARRLAA
jgi:hypothetical protein